MTVLGFLLMLLVAAIVGWIADLIVPGRLPWGWLGAIIAGLVGAWIGTALLGAWGPEVGGLFLVPAIIGAIIFAFIVDLVLKATVRRPAV
ncbi:MAG: GlsB/YeaQ/YmgE family stress response membrane protein [Chloroflexi bacterium]|nr:GlsB/YeaQ/YmgE family stress response membrane protein [Chloroflexota bacterium]